MPTDATMTIGELARSAGVPTTTVRYYERRGLLRPDRRSRARYRLYGPESLERLRFVRAAQAAGFTLRDIESLLSLRFEPTAPRPEVQRLIEDRLTHVAAQIEALREVQTALRQWLDRCRWGRSDRCEVLEGLRNSCCEPLDPAVSEKQSETGPKKSRKSPARR